MNFYNCKKGNKAIKSLQDITTNEFVTNVNFYQESVDYSPIIEKTEKTVKTTSPNKLILDNLDNACRFIGFDYKTDVSGFTNEDYHEATVPEGFSNFKAAIYEPKIKGKYEVYIYWDTIKDAASNAKWIVYHGDGYTTKYFNQSKTRGWHHHGNYKFDASSYVRLSLPGYFQVADGNVVADAVKFIKIE